MTSQQEKEFRDFYWETEKHKNRELGIDGYIDFINKLLKEEKENHQSDIRAVLGMLKGNTSKGKISNYIMEYMEK